MATGNISESNLTPYQDTLKPRIGLATMFRLGLFQMGLGIMSLLTLGVINRVMIEELKVPALIAAGAISMHQFVSPTRIWFGQMSDSKPLFGNHRTGYVWIGSALFTTISFIAVQVVWQLGSSLEATGWSPTTYFWAGVLALAFSIYGVALSASSTPFAALLVDVSDEDNRPKLVSIVWSMLMVGIIVGAIVSSGLLKQISLDTPIEQLQASVNRLFLIVPAIVLVLTGIATVGVEKKYSRFGTRSNSSNRDDQIGLSQALRVLTASRQTGIFFTFLLVMSISLFMQDAVMEPYGGEVFGMAISETTQLNAFFGMGTLIGIASTGFLVVPRLGKQNTTKLGCVCAAVCLGLIIMAGFTEKPEMLMGSLLLYGLASGIITTGAISLMLDLTAAETAGTFIGAWGLAQAIARGLSTVSGGAVLDLGRFLFGIPVLSYSLVFATQAVGMILAVVLLRRVNIHEFRENAKDAIAAVMAGELD
ncbi:BCD family MFS transporter [Phormidium pseudopriestleyi FRX01]|uniref:BCD family MFS transporter n=1 Tax=Phormidium pseudopriestleyi FRX01 TaxID=1759528 RepID=A0ABS3FX76_9CYAN|nr:BCD family MFS transporter [Phormidium pseudopriestleyi]MBO0351688.1 BCD family MFS transporter [Phormidium pseudopriestleyi FRX01]